MRRRSILLVVTLACVLAIASAAGANEVVIRVAHWLGDPVHGSAAGSLFDAVQAQVAPYGIRIETPINSTQDYENRVITQTAGGVGPDIIFALPYGNFSIHEILTDLTPFLSRDPELNFGSFIPSVWDIFTYNDGTWLLPVGIAPYLLFYNEDHFQESGVPYPDETWRWLSEIPDALVKLRREDGDGNVTRHGLLMENRLWTQFMSQGGEVLNADGTEALIENPDVYELLEEIYRWRQEDLIPAATNHRPTFAAGRGAMHGMMGTFAFPYYADHATDVNWSFALPPLGSAGRRIDENVNGWGISTHTQHPEEAWLVLKAIASVSGEIVMETYGHFSPVIGKTDAETIEYMEHRLGLTPREVQIALEAVNYVRPRFRHALTEDITRLVQGAFSAVAWNGASPGTAFASAAQQINGLLRGATD